MAEKDPAQLKEGFTTGTAATAASLACLTHILTLKPPTSVLTPLPPITEQDGQLYPRTYLHIPIAQCRLLKRPLWSDCKLASNSCQANLDPAQKNNLKPNILGSNLNYTKPLLELDAANFGQAWASVIKDGGSDPDATHKASIEVTLTIKDPNYPQTIEIIGGQGVGIVTLPGLPVKPGSWAINPSPKAQIRFALNNLWQQMVGSSLPPMVVEISVPNGCEIAKKTFNPKLGIIGGISILGTQGTVKPYSHAAFKATIAQELDVAKALNIQDIFFSTGRRSENFLKNSYPNQSQHAFIQIADYLAFAFNEAHRREFKRIFLGCFFGKLVKLAQGHGYTHAHDTTLNLASLGQMIPNKNIACQIACAQTAAQALEILQDNQEGKNIIAQIKSLATEVAQDFAQQKVFIELFDFDGQIL